ncbi:MAG: ABC transporter ATP-binding protein [Ktedonobacterales bacterium]
MSVERSGQRPGGMAGGMGRGGWGAMGRPGEKPKDFLGTAKRLLSYFLPQKFLLLLVLIAAIIGTIFNVIGPKVLGLATTKLFDGLIADYQAYLHHLPEPGVDFGYIGNVLLIMLGLYVISAIFLYLQQYVMAGVSQKAVYILRKQVEEKLNRLPLKYYDSRTHGETMSRAVNDMDNISTTLQQSVTQLITSTVTVIGVLIMMLTISPLLSLVVLLTLPLSLLVTVGIARRSQRYFRDQQRALGVLNGHVEEMYAGHKIVKAFGHEQDSLTTFDHLNDNLYQAGWRAQFMSGMIMPLMRSIGNLGYVIVAVAGAILLTQGSITIGNVQAFVQYAQQFTQPITQLANFANVIQSTMASAERIFEMLDEPEETPDVIDPVATAAFESSSGTVEFEHVRFGYSPDAILMQDMNIDVRPGQMIAIVGPTGAGKTTLVNLLMRFYDVNSGKILVHDVDITQIRRGELRRTFGMVLQDTWLFHGTIRDNIAYGCEGATEEQIVRAAKAAYADHFIRTLPEGYDTVLNEDASNISQGQKQLLTIARAFLANPEMLILDEATSSVDTRTELQIQQAMAQLVQGRTSFVIAHRLSTIRDADLILVMNYGTIVEKGTHEELLAAHGFYADLYNSQFTARPVVEEAAEAGEAAAV